MSGRTHRRFTGYHMVAILVAFFGVVIAVNVVNAIYAARTFGGTVVDNSYVASQKFNGWLKEARAEKALGWRLAVNRNGEGMILVTLTGRAGPLTGARLVAVARHPLGRLPERTLAFRPLDDGRYESLSALPTGRWILHFEMHAQEQTVRSLVDLQ